MSIRMFAVEALSHLPTTAAIVPSSRFLTRAMLRPLRLEQARTVVEFGPGTGPMTRDLLAAMPRDSRLFAFEISPRFAEYLRESIDDPRLILVEDSAENLGHHLRNHGADKVDAVVSSLG